LNADKELTTEAQRHRENLKTGRHQDTKSTKEDQDLNGLFWFNPKVFSFALLGGLGALVARFVLGLSLCLRASVVNPT